MSAAISGQSSAVAAPMLISMGDLNLVMTPMTRILMRIAMANNGLLSEIVNRHYDTLESIVNDLASRCLGGDEVKINFHSGSVTIKLK